MISGQRITYGLLALLAVAAVAAVAQPAKEAVEMAKDEPREFVRDVDLLNRRAMLRASLRTQPALALVREAPAKPARLLMSDQERADLRQQLRQQERLQERLQER